MEENNQQSLYHPSEGEAVEGAASLESGGKTGAVPAAEQNSQPTVQPAPVLNSSYNYIPYGYTKETYEEKKNIMRCAATVTIPAIIMFVFLFFWDYLYFFFVQLFGVSVNEAYDFISNPAVISIFQIILSVLMFSVPFILSAKISGYNISDIVPLEKPKKGTFLPFLIFGVGFCSFTNIIFSYAENIFNSFGIEYNLNFSDDPKGIFGFLIAVLSTAIVPGLIEEFACRGIVFGILEKYGQSFAIICSAAVFGIIHGNFNQIPFAFMIGLVLAFIRIKTGSIWCGCAIHAINNLVSVVLSNCFDNFSDWARDIIYIVFFAITILLSIISLIVISKMENSFKIEPSKTAASGIKKFKWFFSSVPAIIFCVIYFGEAVSYFFR